MKGPSIQRANAYDLTVPLAQNHETETVHRPPQTMKTHSNLPTVLPLGYARRRSFRGLRRMQTLTTWMLLSALVVLGSLPQTASAQTVQVTIPCSDHGNVSPKDTQTVPANSDLDITATPDIGYEIYDWYINGSPGGWTVNQIQLHLGDLDVAVHVVFQRITNLVYVTAGLHGQVSPDGNGAALRVGWGDSVTFTATPALPRGHLDGGWSSQANRQHHVFALGCHR